MGHCDSANGHNAPTKGKRKFYNYSKFFVLNHHLYIAVFLSYYVGKFAGKIKKRDGSARGQHFGHVSLDLNRLIMKRLLYIHGHHH
jgi:hypothetical protein